jgi:thioester reductase-like protein
LRDNTRNLFITGATGFLASNLLQRLLTEEKNHLYLLIRAGDNRSLLQRKDALINRLFAKDDRDKVASRIHVFNGDISKKGLGLDRKESEKLRNTIDMVYHSAAMCDFSCTLGVIRKTNVTGTRNVLELALDWQENGHLEGVSHISTAYVAGNHSGIFHEKDVDVSQDFNNAYEQSKFEAELAVSEYRKKGLRVDIYRPSIITDTSPPGMGTVFGIIKILKFIAKETFEIIPADSNTRINLIPVNIVSQAIHLISTTKDRPLNQNYQIVDPQPIKFGTLLDTISNVFGTETPMCIPAKIFPMDRLSAFQKKILEYFTPYMNQRLSFDTQNAASVLQRYGFSMPSMREGELARLFEYYRLSGLIAKKGIPA